MAKGRRTGIFDVWRDAQKQVNGFSASRFKGFKVRGTQKTGSQQI
jgi:viroplasmin and RNaseH domain-containing protein